MLKKTVLLLFVCCATRLFAQDDEGLVVARAAIPHAVDHDDARKAAAACPVAAIEIDDDAEAS